MQIFLLRLASFVREMPKNGEDNGQNCRRSRLSKILPLLSPASPFVFSIRLHKCVFTIKKFATSLSPHSGPNMTHLSAGLRFVGTHLSIETSLSVPPWPAHHWCMVSPRKETVDFTLQVRSPPAPVGQSGSSGGAGGGEGRFLGGALSTTLLLCCLLAPPAPPSDHPAYTSSLLLLLLLWYLGGKQPNRCCCCVSSRSSRVVSSLLLTDSRLGRPTPFPNGLTLKRRCSRSNAHGRNAGKCRERSKLPISRNCTGPSALH